jgi:hypothetical protein
MEFGSIKLLVHYPDGSNFRDLQTRAVIVCCTYPSPAINKIRIEGKNGNVLWKLPLTRTAKQ